MKRILLLLLVVCSVLAYGQTSPKFNFVIENASTAFGINLPKGCLVYDLGTDKFYILTAPAASSATLTTATKVQYPSMTGSPSQNKLALWDSDKTIKTSSICTDNGTNLTVAGPIASNYTGDVGTIYLNDNTTYIEGNSAGGYSGISFFVASSYGLTYSYNSGDPFFAPDLVPIDLGVSGGQEFGNLFTNSISDNGSKVTIDDTLYLDVGTTGNLSFDNGNVRITGSNGVYDNMKFYIANTESLTLSEGAINNSFYAPILTNLGTGTYPWNKLWTADLDLSGVMTFDNGGSSIDAFTETITADDDTDVPTEGAVYNYVTGYSADHGGLTGLADDDHTQYALLAGRSGNVLNMDTIKDVSTGLTVVFKDNIKIYGESSSDYYASLSFNPQEGNSILSYNNQDQLNDGTYIYFRMNNNMGSRYGVDLAYRGGFNNFEPEATGTVNLGQSDRVWKRLYTTNLTDDFTNGIGIGGTPSATYKLKVWGSIQSSTNVDIGGNLTFDDAGSTIDAFTTSITSDDDTDVPTEGAVYDRTNITDNYVVVGTGTGIEGTTDLTYTGGIFTTYQSAANAQLLVETDKTDGLSQIRALSYDYTGIYSYGSTMTGTTFGINRASTGALLTSSGPLMVGSLDGVTYIGSLSSVVARFGSSGFGLTNYASLNADALTSTISSDDDTDLPTEGAVYDRTNIANNYVVVGTGTGIEGTSNFTYSDNTELIVKNSSYDLYWNASGFYGTSGGGSPPLGTSSARWQKLWTGSADFTGSLQFNQAGSLIDAFTETITADDDTDLPTEGAVYNYAEPKFATLAISKGGTNSGTALTNDKVMVSSTGAIVESASITTTELGLLDGLTAIDGSTTNEIEVSDEVYNSTNFDGGTTAGVSQDDFYDFQHLGDTDDDGLTDKVDLASAGFVKTNASGVLSVDATTYGNVSNTGTPVDNQIAVWTSSTVVEGDADLTFDGSNLTMTGLTVIDPTPNADHSGSGTASIQTAAQTIGFGQLCYLNSSGKMALADADASSTTPGYFVCLVSAGLSTDQTGLFLESGYIRDDTWNWTTVGGYVFISTTAGSFDESAPSGTGDQSQIVGIVMSADIIKFLPRAVVQIQ